MADEVSLRVVVEAQRRDKESTEELFNILRMLGFTVGPPKGYWREAVLEEGSEVEVDSYRISVSHNPSLAAFGKPTCLLKVWGDKYTFDPVADMESALEAINMFVEQAKACRRDSRVGTKPPPAPPTGPHAPGQRAYTQPEALNALFESKLRGLLSESHLVQSGLQNTYPPRSFGTFGGTSGGTSGGTFCNEAAESYGAGYPKSRLLKKLIGRA